MNQLSTRPEERPFYDVLLRMVGPFLIMLMIGSLIFFLIEVFYRGPHEERLRWVFGLFTLATVLVSRISIEEGLERAALFGFALGIATLITSMTLVDFEYGTLSALEPVVLSMFIIVVMWSANRLTWDCTLIDDSRDVSAIGLVELLSRKISTSALPKSKADLVGAGEPSESEVPASSSASSRLLFLFFAGSNARNTPGLWVLYFSLAAFPIFGVGQWFAQRETDFDQLWLYLLFAGYLGSGLGLLMLTSLLGLERYLHRRGTALPAQISRNWLIVGAAFALAIMLAVLVLPRPDLSGRLQASIKMLISADRDPSELAVGEDGQFEGEGARAARADEHGDGQPANKGQQNNQANDAKSGRSDEGSRNGQRSNQSNDRGDGKNKSPAPTSDQKKQPDSSDNKGERSADDKPDQKSDPNQTRNEQRNQGKPGNDNQPQQQEKNQGQPDRPAARQRQAPRQKAAKNNQPAKNPTRSSKSRSLSQMLEFISRSSSLITYLVGIVIALILLWMFRDEWSGLWQQLFGGKKSDSTEHAGRQTQDQASIADPPARFETYRDPFSSGQARGWTSRQTIEYTFHALEAWARESGRTRDADDTAYEFAAELAGLDRAISSEARNLAELHGRCLYGDQRIDNAEISKLARLWKLMQSTKH